MVSAHLKLLFAFLGYINTRDRDGLASILSDDFVNEGRPSSVGPLGAPAGKEVYLNRLLNTTLIDYFNISMPTTENIVEAKDVIQFYTTSNGRTAHGFPYKMEYMDTVKFEKNKISAFIEFVDPVVFHDTLNKELIAAEAADLHCSK